MPLYFIDFHDCGILQKDDEGSELASFELARDDVVGMLPQIVKERVHDGEDSELMATIRDESGAELYRATLTFHGERLGKLAQ